MVRYINRALPTLRNRSGNAYLFVIVAVLMMALLAGVALSITASSRRASMYYIGFTGLYDLAIAGNEQAFFMLRDLFEQGQTSPSAITVETNRTWQVSVSDGNGATDTFAGVTGVVDVSSIAGDWRLRVHTEVHRINTTHPRTVVQAYVVPTLDGNSLRMINSRRITN